MNDLFTNGSASTEEMQAMLQEFLEGSLFPMMLITVLSCILVAFFSYRVFKLALSVIGSLTAGYLGFSLLAPLVLANIQGLPENVDFAVIIGFVCAIVGWVLMNLLYKLALFVAGAASGYALGAFLATFLATNMPENEFLTSENGALVISIACAVVLGVLFIFLFKPLYILGSAFGGIFAAASTAISAVVSLPDSQIPTIIALVVTVIFGIVASVYQFNHAED